jgi:hypothetical protein
MTTLHRPDPILRHNAMGIDHQTHPRRAAQRLLDGETLGVSDRYSTGLDILDQLHDLMEPPPVDASFHSKRNFRRAWREVTGRLIVFVDQHRVDLAGAPSIGFLKDLYPELTAFHLPLIQVQDLHHAWTIYKNGAHLSVLGLKVHPFYGTYAPSRVVHLELFATWLSQYSGPTDRAVDVGTGCGVLAFMLCKAGFKSVLATDISPNAIESVRRELAGLPTPPPIDLYHGDLLGDSPVASDLIVFNPPWTMGRIEGHVDRALYFEDDLFERFFDQALASLSPTGKLVMVFSNIIQLVQPDVPHPILTELERGRFRQVQLMRRKVKASIGPDGRRRKTKERVEVWELERAPAE